MDYSLLIAYLRQKQHITDLEKDILDTWDELQKSPLDRKSAQAQIAKNNAKYPDVFTAVSSLPTAVLLPFDQVTESDIQYNLVKQLEELSVKEWCSVNAP